MTHAEAPIPIAGGRGGERPDPARASIPGPAGPPLSPSTPLPIPSLRPAAAPPRPGRAPRPRR